MLLSDIPSEKSVFEGVGKTEDVPFKEICVSETVISLT
jgi:hypothetical protein